MLRFHRIFYFLPLSLLMLPAAGYPAENLEPGMLPHTQLQVVEEPAVSVTETTQRQETASTAPGENRAQVVIGNCQEIEYDLTTALTENSRLLQRITEMAESNKKLQKVNTELQNSQADNSFSVTVTELEQKLAVTKSQAEQTANKYGILVDEFHKRGEKIATLQNTVEKHDDKTRFLWFGAGAVVFFAGLLAGKSANRKKTKFTF